MGPLPYDPGRGIPPDKKKIRQRLGSAMIEFVQWIGQNPGEMDDVMREVKLALYREVIDEAAAQGIENALVWHTYAIWSNDGPERIECFTRALACNESKRDAAFEPSGARYDWNQVHMRADCLFEIGRVHFHEGDPVVARGFLLRALPLAQEAERLRAAAGVTNEDRLEGRIAELLLQLPE